MPPEYDSDKQFENECTNLMRVQHHNIVREDKRVLCFEYLLGGSLDKHVSDESCKLDWDTCYKIIKGVSEGLNHLHNDSVFHLDLKPANILLDSNMMTKIGDFGLSRFFPSTETYTTTTCYGTLGYIPPEHINNHQISPKYDVFSLGVIIIQIMAGRKGYNDHGDTTSLKFIESVCEKWQKRVHATMWSHMLQEVKTCIEIALSCVESDRQKRPTISQIVNVLKRIDIEKLSLTCEGFTVFISVRPEHAGLGPQPIYDLLTNPAPSAIGGHADRDIWELQIVTQTSKDNILDYGPRNSNIRAFSFSIFTWMFGTTRAKYVELPPEVPERIRTELRTNPEATGLNLEHRLVYQMNNLVTRKSHPGPPGSVGVNVYESKSRRVVPRLRLID
ncbi:Cysteine-rich receptor-like protein kinase 29 [Triticum urartu]|uniref:non-specific serine/threonine protein kinase n=1 Tax=Triticum urartu TaxID=4572 RepID=M7YE98_TRIUA|nr:Cysteine-rich receptor-like protein kinase 29 [Triticum urartu]